MKRYDIDGHDWSFYEDEDGNYYMAEDVAPLIEAIKQLFEVLDAHDIDTLDCDRAGVVHCDCLEKVRKKITTLLNAK